MEDIQGLDLDTLSYRDLPKPDSDTSCGPTNHTPHDTIKIEELSPITASLDLKFSCKTSNVDGDQNSNRFGIQTAQLKDHKSSQLDIEQHSNQLLDITEEKSLKGVMEIELENQIIPESDEVSVPTQSVANSYVCEPRSETAMSAAEIVRENEDVGSSQSYGISTASHKGSNNEAISGDDRSMNTVPNLFNYIIKIPRNNDERLREQVRLAGLQLDERTELKNHIQVQIKAIRAYSQTFRVDYKSHKTEERNAQKLVKLKRIEIDYLQSTINKVKNAISIEDIKIRISIIDHMIQHETISLKEEKQLMHEIKQLERLGEQLSSNMGNPDEIMEAFERKEELEERLKIVRKELGTLKDKVLKAESAAAEAYKKYQHENEKVKKLQVQLRTADLCQKEAYAQWQNRKRDLWEKNEHYQKYIHDSKDANNYAHGKNREALHQHCTNQVEKIMELWNTNDEFRKQYVSSNLRRTVSRFKTMDGRSLGPDEKPYVKERAHDVVSTPINVEIISQNPTPLSYVNERVHEVVSTPINVEIISQKPTPEVTQGIPIVNGTCDDKSIKKSTEYKNPTEKKVAFKAVLGNGSGTIYVLDAPQEVHEETEKSREEIEVARKAKETKREEYEAELKEQCRLEDLAKANEARERKKRQAEKIQMRAESKAKKEAEQREKEREKRLRKKERTKVDGNDEDRNNCDFMLSSDNGMAEKIEAKGATKKHQKPSTLTKQGTTKSIPIALRNRNRRNWQQYVWVFSTSLLVFILFWLGNLGVFPNVNLKRPDPFY